MEIQFASDFVMSEVKDEKEEYIQVRTAGCILDSPGEHR